MISLKQPSFEVKPYEELEWIASSGTQYIDSGIVSNTLASTNIKAKFACYDVSAGQFIAGSQTGSDYRTFLQIRESGKMGFGETTIYRTNSVVLSNNIEYELEATLSGSSPTLKLNGTSISSSRMTTNIGRGNSSIYVFASHTDSSVSDYFKGRISYLQIYSDTSFTTLVRDYIPVRLLTTVTNSSGGSSVMGDVGLWDKVTDTFYENKGSGAFQAGASKNAVWLIKDGVLQSGYQKMERGRVTNTGTMSMTNTTTDGLLVTTYTGSASAYGLYYWTLDLTDYSTQYIDYAYISQSTRNNNFLHLCRGVTSSFANPIADDTGSTFGTKVSRYESPSSSSISNTTYDISSYTGVNHIFVGIFINNLYANNGEFRYKNVWLE